MLNAIVIFVVGTYLLFTHSPRLGALMLAYCACYMLYEEFKNND